MFIVAGTKDKHNNLFAVYKPDGLIIWNVSSRGLNGLDDDNNSPGLDGGWDYFCGHTNEYQRVLLDNPLDVPLVQIQIPASDLDEYGYTYWAGAEFPILAVFPFDQLNARLEDFVVRPVTRLQPILHRSPFILSPGTFADSQS